MRVYISDISDSTVCSTTPKAVVGVAARHAPVNKKEIVAGNEAKVWRTFWVSCSCTRATLYNLYSAQAAFRNSLLNERLVEASVKSTAKYTLGLQGEHETVTPATFLDITAMRAVWHNC